MMRIVDAMLAIPTLFLALVVVAIVSPNEAILILVIALTSWLTTPRLVRGEAVSLRVREYVQAMKVMGGSGIRAATRHIASNAVGTIMVNATFQPTRSPSSSRSASWGSASRHRSRTRAACSATVPSTSMTATGGSSSARAGKTDLSRWPPARRISPARSHQPGGACRRCGHLSRLPSGSQKTVA